MIVLFIKNAYTSCYISMYSRSKTSLADCIVDLEWGDILTGEYQRLIASIYCPVCPSGAQLDDGTGFHGEPFVCIPFLYDESTVARYTKVCFAFWWLVIVTA